MSEFAGALHIISLSESGVLCTASPNGEPFRLPRFGHVHWDREPEAGRTTHAVVPAWLAAKHRQLVGDAEFERVKDEQRPIATEITTMANRAEDAGNGALFKNDRKEKPTHPDYRGDITIGGKKFWASGWIKEGAKGKYMSLAFSAADDERKPSAAARASASAPNDDLPF
jgi:hypothetical protein